MKSAYTIAKRFGDDSYSWCLLKNGRPIMTGMMRREAQYQRDLHRKLEQERRCQK